MTKQRKPQIETVRDHIAWSYANLARAHAALRDGVTAYQRIHHIIRNKIFHGLVNGSMKMRPLYDDERVKMVFPRACCYCGAIERLSIDHLIPRMRGGAHDADNLVWACRSCNSSKQGHDMLEWMKQKRSFPSILLLRRYVKLVARYCDEQGLLSTPLLEALQQPLPFALSLLPHSFPPLTELRLWVPPETRETPEGEHE